MAGPLLRPNRLYSRQEVLAHPSPIPKKLGVYAWYFREVPPGVPLDGCHVHQDLPLLYVGISPKAPPLNGRPPSKEIMASRLKTLSLPLNLDGNRRHPLAETLSTIRRRAKAVADAAALDSAD